MKLYYLPGACSLAPHIVLEWLGKPYQTEEVARDALKSPAYLAINPLGAVPALADGDWVLTQNVAILEYLAEQAPESGLLGDGSPRSRAEVRRWLGFVNSDVHRTYGMVFRAAEMVPGEAVQHALQANAAARLRQLYEVADRQLAKGTYLTGDRPSVADPYLYVTLRWARAKSIDLSGLDNLARFFATMGADPGVQAALKAEGLEP